MQENVLHQNKGVSKKKEIAKGSREQGPPTQEALPAFPPSWKHKEEVMWAHSEMAAASKPKEEALE